MSVWKIETNIIASKSDRTSCDISDNVLPIYSNIRASTLILTISLSEIKEKMSNLVLIKTNYKKPAQIHFHSKTLHTITKNE